MLRVPIQMTGSGYWKESLMSDYHRFTKECSFGQLRPELARAIREYAQNHRELGNVEVEVLMCCETTSEKKRARHRVLPGARPRKSRASE